MTYKTFELLVAWGGEFSKWLSVEAVDVHAAFADICEIYGDQPQLVTYKLREGQL